MKIIKFTESVNVSESLKYHLENNKPITENIFRPGSEAFYEVIKEARELFDLGKVNLCDVDKELYESTEIGKFGMFNGELVPLDIPMENIEELNEAEYKGKKVELNKPKRGGSKKFYVYVKDPQSGNIKKVSFGAKSGGGNLAVKLKDPKARKAFSDRHNCPEKTDKTTAGYWACSLPRFAKSLGLSGGGRYW